MNTKTKWQIRRERGRGRKLFWGIVLVFAIVSLMSVAHGFGRERGRSHFGGGSTHGSTIENPVELRDDQVASGRRERVEQQAPFAP